MIEFIFRPIDRWPQEPTRHRRRAPFRVPYPKTLTLLSYEFGRIGVRKVYLQADVAERDIRLDGQLRADASPRSPRVIVSGESKHGPISLPCDTFDHWQDNLRAIALSLEALRAVDRYGVTKRGEQYRGLKQLTAGDGPINSDEAAIFVAKHYTAAENISTTARAILDSPKNFDLCYREVAKRLHPDVAGEAARPAWDRLQHAAAILREHHASASR